MSKQRRGFTIVELLVVIVVIAILAAIVIVAYNGITQRARVATVNSDLEGAAKQLAIDQTLNSAYPATVAAANNGAGLKASTGTTYQYAVDNTASPQTYCITATNGTTSYYSSSTNNVPTSGSCSITNLAVNPSASNIAYWGTYGGGSGGGTTPIILSQVTSAWSPTATAMRVTAGSGATSNNAEIGTRSTYVVTVPASGTITASMWLKASSTRPVAGYLRLRGTSDVTGSSVLLTTTPQQLTVTTSVFAPGTGVGITYKEPGGYVFNSGDWIEASELIVTDGSTLYKYADGNSLGWIWNGTANASTSTGPPL